MAKQGTVALTEDEHAQLLELIPLVKERKLTYVDLAAKFRCSVPTAMKYGRLPLGARPVAGRPKKKRTPSSGIPEDPEETPGTAKEAAA